MTETLINIQELNGIKTVNARELHAKLAVGRDFSTWIKNRIEKYGFVEDMDYVAKPLQTLFPQNGEAQPCEFADSTNKIEYFLTLDMAKQLCMVENNETGVKFRKYFIECEKVAKQATIANDILPTRIDSKFMLAVSQRMAELETDVQQLTIANDEKQEFIEVIQDSGKSRVYKKNLRAECNRIAKIINAKYDIPFKDIWDRAYKLLFNQHFVDWKYEFYQAQNKLSFLALKDICYLKDLKDILISMSKPDKAEVTA